MYFEASGEPDRAYPVYGEILVDLPGNEMAMKRLVRPYNSSSMHVPNFVHITVFNNLSLPIMSLGAHLLRLGC